MSRALITGARGFIGQHLARKLSTGGWSVVGIGHGAWTEFEREAIGVEIWLNGEITKRNLEIVSADNGMFDAIFHLAGGSAVGPSFIAPEEDFRRSVLSTLELLEWARAAAPAASVVLSSSAAVYGAGYSRPISEADPVSPYSPYGTHKRIAESLAESYSKSFGLKTAIVRLFSVYGPGLRKQMLWDACKQLASQSGSLTLGGTGNEVRDWVHVSDAVEFLVSAASQASCASPIFNGGVGEEITVGQVAGHLAAAWGRGQLVEFTGAGRIGDPRYLVADVERLRALGYRPTIHWTNGVEEYVRWFRSTGLGAR